MGLMLSLFLATGLAGEAPGGPATCERPLHLSGATLRGDGEPVQGPFSLLQSRAGYLFLYVPGRGLAVVASRPFGRRSRRVSFAAGRWSSPPVARTCAWNPPRPSWARTPAAPGCATTPATF
jgi:hypothetical protein